MLYAPVGKVKGSNRKKATRQTKKEYGAPAFKMYMRYNFWQTVLVLCAVITTGTILVNENSGDSWTVSYWLRGDRSVNGDAWSRVNVNAWAFGVSLGMLVMSLVNYSCLRENFFHDDSWSNHTNNLAWYGPLGLTDCFMSMALAQVTGNSNIWTMIYVGLMSLLGDWVAASIRVVWADSSNGGRKNKGSSIFAVLSFIGAKMAPMIYLAVCASRNGLSMNVTAAFFVYFSVMALRVTVAALCYFLGMWFENMDFYRYIYMQPSAVPVNVDSHGNDTRTHARSFILAHKTGFQYFLFGLFVLNLACTLVFTLQVFLGFGGSNDKKAYSWITWALSKPGGVSYNMEFDRTWPLAQFGVPFQFGLLTLIALYQWFRFDAVTVPDWLMARDYLNDGAYAVADFFTIWATLSINGTTEFPELFFAAYLGVICLMIITEARRNYPWYYVIIPNLLFLLPFVHASISLAAVTTRSNQVLGWTIVAFSLYFVRALAFTFARYKRRKDHKGNFTNLYHWFDDSPHWFVIGRFLFNWSLRFIFLGMWWSGCFNHGWEITNSGVLF